jgi:hypothetical protein
MARRAWIAILGFGLVLFLLVDAFLLWYEVEVARNMRGFLGLAFFMALTWDVYRALRRRIDSEPKKQNRDHSFSVSKGSTTSCQPKP